MFYACFAENCVDCSIKTRTHHGASTDLDVAQDGSHGIVDLGLDGHSIGDNDASHAKKLSEGLEAITSSTVNDYVKGFTMSKVLKLGIPLVYIVDVNELEDRSVRGA